MIADFPRLSFYKVLKNQMARETYSKNHWFEEL